MIKNLLRCIFLFTLISCGDGIDISGKWVWKFTNEHGETHQVEVQLNEIKPNEVAGFYCSAYGNGSFVDCAAGDSENKNIPNFELKRITKNKFLGSFRSNRATETDANGEIKVTYLPLTETLLFDMILEPSGSFYFPDEVEFVKE